MINDIPTALKDTLNVLMRMREIAYEATNSTLGSSD